MPTTKEAIAEALLQLDQANPELWTDDGSPLVSAVQHLCNDDKITRAQINDASPGFVRKMVSLDEKTQEPVAAIAEKPPAPIADADDELDDMLGEDEAPREMLARHIREADLAIQDAKQALAEAQRHVINCERVHARKLQLYNSKFPPITAAQNIKDHLARQQEIRYELVTGQKMPVAVLQNPIDATLSDRHRANGRNRQSNAQAAPYLPRKAAVNY